MPKTDVELVNLDGGPGELDGHVRRRTPRPVREPRKPSGTKIQTQVPREWRQKVVALARERGVREADVVRMLVGRGLGELTEVTDADS